MHIDYNYKKKEFECYGYDTLFYIKKKNYQ